GLKIIEQIACETSAGMPTSHGSQYLGMRSWPIMSQGWTKTAAPSSSASAKRGNSSARSRFQSPAWEPICTPARPSSRTQRWSSRSEEHTSELQSLTNLVCRLLLEKKNTTQPHTASLARYARWPERRRAGGSKRGPERNRGRTMTAHPRQTIYRLCALLVVCPVN